MRVLALPLLGLALGACSSGDDSGSSAPKDGAPFDLEAATALYAASGCTMCHGADGAGGMMGPELRGLGQHWTRPDLARFIADPAPFLAEDARIAQQAAQYQMPMQPQPDLAEADREQLAALVLSW